MDLRLSKSHYFSLKLVRLKNNGLIHAASVVCDILISILTRKTAETRCRNVGIALGGTHYPKKFNQILLESEFGLAAVAPRHNLKSVDESMLDQMIFKKVTHGIVDRKGLGKEKNRILKLIDKNLGAIRIVMERNLL